MNLKLENKKRYLVKNIPRLIRHFDYRKGPTLYFYKRVISVNGNKSLSQLFGNNYFMELIYATLTSWDMNTRSAKMKDFEDFRDSILSNKKCFLKLESLKLDKLTQKDFVCIRKILSKLYDGLNLMETKSKLVSNSKVMHFFLPHLIMPMDRKNTLEFFFGNITESKNKFLDIFECSYNICKEIELHRFLDNKWNASLPKIIDNAIISYNSKR